jgi:hypothetical protein
MTIAELIEELHKYDGSSQVVAMYDDFCHDVKLVEAVKVTTWGEGQYAVCYYPEVEEEPLTEVILLSITETPHA